MKKRITSLLLAFLMVISLAPTALAAEGDPPYSLKYLEGIEGTKYMQYLTGDDSATASGTPVTQYTAEFYDVKDLWNSVDGDWAKIVAPFRQRFTSAGFSETTLTDSNGEPVYRYENGSGHRFMIDGWTTVKGYLTGGVAVLIEHVYSEEYRTQQTTQPAADGAPYSLKYLEGIAGANYLDYLTMDDSTNSTGNTITKRTIEVYGVSDLSGSVNGDWAKIVAPFRQRFIDAGFKEWTDQYEGETEYYFEDGSGHRFIICSKTTSQSYMESGVGLAIDHLYSEAFKSQETTGTTTQPSIEPAAGSAPYSQKYVKNIQGIELLDTWENDDDTLSSGAAVSQITLDFYGVSALSNSVGGDWEKIIAPFRKAFTDAGFDESTDSNPYNENDTDYYYHNGHGERFIILGKSETQGYMESGVGVCIEHLYSVDYGALENFKKTQTYTPGQFSDVPESKWYAKTVQTAYELGLVKGSGEGFAPDNNMTVAEALVLACRIHDIYYGGKGEFTQGKPWYQVYVDYAIEYGIILESDFADYTAPINREEFAYVMYRAVPDCALKAINSVAIGDISDSSSIQDACVTPVLSLYNAGILTGGSDGSFKPLDNIKRSEVATIVARMAIESERVTLG